MGDPMGNKKELLKLVKVRVGSLTGISKGMAREVLKSRLRDVKDLIDNYFAMTED